MCEVAAARVSPPAVLQLAPFPSPFPSHYAGPAPRPLRDVMGVYIKLKLAPVQSKSKGNSPIKTYQNTDMVTYL